MDTSATKQQLLNPASEESLLKDTLLSRSLTREELAQIVAYLASKGWNRKKFYDVCRYINLNEDLLEEEHDSIGNFIDALTGFIETSVIIKLPGEPEEREAFLNYVYSDWWKD